MSVESTRNTLTAYLETLAQRGPYQRYFADSVTFTTAGSDQVVKGSGPVEQFIRWFHETAFDAHPQVNSTIIGDGQAAAEFNFVGTHTGEFFGVPASGNQVNVPYTAVYDFKDDKITALRLYMPMDLLMKQIGAVPAPATART